MKKLGFPVFLLILAFNSCKLNKEEVLPANSQSVEKEVKELYTQEELAKIIEKFNAVPISSNDSERKLVSSQGYMYCNGQCAFIVNTYSYNLFGVNCGQNLKLLRCHKLTAGNVLVVM